MPHVNRFFPEEKCLKPAAIDGLPPCAGVVRELTAAGGHRATCYGLDTGGDVVREVLCLCWRSQRGWGQSNLHPQRRPQGRRKEHQHEACNIRRPRRVRGRRDRASPGRASRAPFAVQSMVIGDVLAGHDVLARPRPARARRSRSACRSSSASKASDARPCGADPRPDPRARAPDRRGAASDRPRPRAVDRAPSTAAAGIVKQAQARRPRPHPRGDARAPARPARHAATSRSTRADARPRRGRPDARHGVQPGVDRIVKMPARAPDAVVLGDARGRGRPHREGLHHQPARHEHAHSAERKGDVEHRFVDGQHDGKVDTLVAELRGRART